MVKGFFVGRGSGVPSCRYLETEDGFQRTDDGGQTTEDRRQTTDDRGLRVVALEFYCQTPGLEEEPVVLKVYYDGRVLDEVVFSGESEEVKGKRRKRGRRLGGLMSCR